MKIKRLPPESWLSSLITSWAFGFVLLLIYLYFLMVGYEYEGKSLFEIVFS
jgi:hypothetical protein